jgi:hypothetical protein
MATIPKRLCKPIITLAFVTILAVVILGYKSGAAHVIIESRCQTPFIKDPICAHCLRFPQNIHSSSFYKLTVEEKYRLGIRSCKNYSCSEMLLVYNDQS